MKKHLPPFFTLFLFFFVPVFAGEVENGSLQALHALFAPRETEAPNFDIPAGDRMIVVNTLVRVREGICYIGKTKRKPASPTLEIFRNNHDNLIPVQYVPDPSGGDVFFMYADFSYADPKMSVPGLGAVLLEFDAEETAKKRNFESVLSIDAETGEMKNDSIRLLVEPKTGKIRSLKMIGIDHDLVQDGKELYDWSVGGTFGDEEARLTVTAAGPLVASMLVQTGKRKQQITIFNDSERIRFVEIDEAERRPSVFRTFFLNIPQSFTKRGKEPLEYSTLANEACGVNIVGLDNECWLWPYTATFNGGVAFRFACQVRRPLLRLEPGDVVRPKPGPLALDDDRFLSVVDPRPAGDRSGAILVDVFNPTDEIMTAGARPILPYEKIRRSNEREERLDEAGTFEIGPGKTVVLRLE